MQEKSDAKDQGSIIEASQVSRVREAQSLENMKATKPIADESTKAGEGDGSTVDRIDWDLQRKLLRNRQVVFI